MVKFLGSLKEFHLSRLMEIALASSDSMCEASRHQGYAKLATLILELPDTLLLIEQEMERQKSMAEQMKSLDDMMEEEE